jgi:hypothetical protein
VKSCYLYTTSLLILLLLFIILSIPRISHVICEMYYYYEVSVINNHIMTLFPERVAKIKCKTHEIKLSFYADSYYSYASRIVSNARI